MVKTKCTIYDRTCGYYAPRDTMNEGKIEEVKGRRRFIQLIEKDPS